MSARLLTECGLCGSQSLETVLSLGSSPPTCVMVPIGAEDVREDRHPLELWRCCDCTLVQLSTIVDPEVVFPPGYPYSSGNSRALHADFEDLARQATEWAQLGPQDLVVDIGANDGTLLSKFACRTVGVEPTMQANRIEGPFYRTFFTEKLGKQIREEHGPARVITACNVLAHVEDIHDVMRGIQFLLADDGVLIAENHDLGSVVGGQWDTVYHEHLRFYDPWTFDTLLRMHGLASWEWTTISTHGGSFRTIAERRQAGMSAPPQREYLFEEFADNAVWSRKAIRKSIRPGMWGIGATARATTIINYCGLDVDDIACVVEVAGSDKIGHYIPGTRIPVIDEAALFDEQPLAAMLFSWHLAGSIIPKLREAGYQGTIVVPLPSPRVYGAERVAA